MMSSALSLRFASLRSAYIGVPATFWLLASGTIQSRSRIEDHYLVPTRFRQSAIPLRYKDVLV